MPAKLRTAKGRHPTFSAEALALFVELERKRTRAFSDGSRELARMLGLTSEWWTGNHLNDRSAGPCHPPWCADAELAALLDLAAPLQPRERARFLEAIAAELRAHPGELGAGAVHRVGSRLQRQFLRTVSGPAE
jgi:hypothetical protein